MNTTELVFEVKPEKNLGPYGIWTHNLCDTSAALYQLSQEFFFFFSWKEISSLFLQNMTGSKIAFIFKSNVSVVY